jgi:hypothetical protein
MPPTPALLQSASLQTFPLQNPMQQGAAKTRNENFQAAAQKGKTFVKKADYCNLMKILVVL